MCCIRRLDGTDLTEYVNDTNRPYTEVLTAYNINSGTDRESYTYAEEMRVSRNRFWNEARDLDHDQMSYYLYDGRGSVTANTWYNGMVTAAYQYDPYGQLEHGSTKHTDFYGYNNVADTIKHILINPCYIFLKEEETIRLAKLENIIQGDPKLFGKGWIKNQRNYTFEMGTFGPLGNIGDNGCGSVSLHNVLRILGYANDYGELIMEMNRIWDMAMIFGGILGSNPFYIIKYLMQYSDLDFTFYIYSNPDEADIISEDHTAYLNLYFYKLGAHYTASRFSAGYLLYNDSPHGDYKTYFEKSGSEFMLVVGIDRL